MYVANYLMQTESKHHVVFILKVLQVRMLDKYLIEC